MLCWVHFQYTVPGEHHVRGISLNNLLEDADYVNMNSGL